MDIVTDLTSQAISFLTLLQDILKDQGILTKRADPEEYMPAVRNEMAIFKQRISGLDLPGEPPGGSGYYLDEKRLNRIKEVLFCSLDAADADRAVVPVFFDISSDLLSWLDGWQQSDTSVFPVAVYTNTPILLMSPDEWRRNIRHILYVNQQERMKLARIIHYMPVMIIVALGEKDKEKQRIFQVYSDGKDDELLSKNHNEASRNWWSDAITIGQNEKTGSRLQLASDLLNDDEELFKCLVTDNPVSFEMSFNKELDRIQTSRIVRLADADSENLEDIYIKVAEPVREFLRDSENPALGYVEKKIKLSFSDDIPYFTPPGRTVDPLRRAEGMQLTALALSGGGIRSATFNLGVIQKLAEKGVLHHIDYLSTVSGGGYIGSWLLSWIYRAGSISKVVSRLDTRKSTDPMADEVRPLRWLRMYSNYLAPNASIMSADAWTIGITWLRNTLINQSILLLLLCAVLSAVETVYKGWEWLAADVEYKQLPTTISASIMLIAGTLLAGFGMRTFDKELPQKGILRYGRNNLLAVYLVGWALVFAFLLSAWLYKVTDDTYRMQDKLLIFLIPSFVALACIVSIAYVGNYQKHKRFKKWDGAFLLILLSSAAAIAATFLLLAGVWKFYEGLRISNVAASNPWSSPDSWITRISNIKDVKMLAFTFGLPIVLEVMSLGVVVRMFIMGIFFSDERREWWGRTGAVLHRFIFIWILMTISVFSLPKLVNNIGKAEIESFIGLLGGWAAIIGVGVRMAFSSTTSGENQDKSGFNAKETFVRFVPYLFMIGFLLIGSATLKFLQGLNILEGLEFLNTQTRPGALGIAVLETIILGLITALLSWRAGVNEFTLHHFYRNRLIRAYLGATRRRTDRMQTANGFTGFDSKDDIALDEFSKSAYYGPYPLINTALNATVVSELDRQDRKAESFLFSPLFCGFDFSATRAAAYDQNGVSNYGYRPTSEFAGTPSLGTAMAISGAAVNPNMGYHSSAATAFLLSVFNVKLGWWIGNPRTEQWKNPEPFFGLAYLVSDLIGKSDMSSKYVSLSDGGHFDNMGLYELVRRRCSLIILCDAEEDDTALCEGLAMAVRRCRIDFGVEIEIDTSPITKREAATKLCQSHVAEGIIKYPGNASEGRLIYIKTSLNGDEPVDVREYKMQNPLFPQQPTSDQFFTEEQFESYRKLGYHSLS